MKSKLVILSLLLAGTSVAMAQNEGAKERFYSEKFGDNIFISAGVGAQLNVNPDNFDYGFGHAITPLIQISVGKFFDPVWGTRVQFAGMWSTLYSQYGMTSGYNKIKNKNYVTLHADGLMNLTNFFAGYKEERLFTLSAFAGPGLTFAKAFGNQRTINALINGSVGLIGQFNINKYLDLNLEARGEISPSIFGKESSAYTDGAVSLTAGLSYTFGGKKFVSCGDMKVDESAINEEVNRYRRELADAQADLAKAKNDLANVEPVTKEVIKEVAVAGPRAIFFEIGSSKINARGMVNLEMAAKLIKANPGKKYKIAGYADKATGSAKLNQKLSEKRAQVVYDALVKEGVNADQLELIGYGGMANMFDKNALNRVVILE